jgi:apolipoprotein D and lipocalin family protein
MRRAAASAIVAFVLSACAHQPPLPTADSFDLDRFYGRWYIVARIPYFLEHRHVGCYEDFVPLPNGDIADHYVAQRENFFGSQVRYTGRYRVKPGGNNARMSFIPIRPFAFPVSISYVDSSYSYFMLTYASRSLGWIYAKEPSLPEGDYRALLHRLELAGYDPSRFRKVPQRPEEVGAPGYE